MIRFIVFLILNFGALGLGAFLMGSNPGENQWYQELNKAPWTPPGWVFGAAWTLIMVSYSVFLAVSYKSKEKLVFLILFAAQWLLNVFWNPLFFKYHLTLIAFLEISLLFGVLLNYLLLVRGYRIIFLLPYVIWLVIAISLNGYVILKN
jgi:tryptophan-rich sensory protein